MDTIWQLEQATRNWVYGAESEPPKNGVPYELARETVEDFITGAAFLLGNGPINPMPWGTYPIRWGSDPTVYLGLVIHVASSKNGQAWVLGLCRVNAELADESIVFKFIHPVVIAEYSGKSEKVLLSQIGKVTNWYRREVLGTSVRGRPKGTGNYSDDEWKLIISQVEQLIKQGVKVTEAVGQVLDTEPESATRQYYRAKARLGV